MIYICFGKFGDLGKFRSIVTKKRGRFQTTDTLDVGQTHPVHHDPEFRPQCPRDASMVLRHITSNNSQLFPQIQSYIRLSRHNSGHAYQTQIFHSKLHRDISFGLANICVKIVQVAQHLDITDSQLLKPTDHPHLVLRTSGSTLIGSHNNLASTPKHQTMHCWLNSSTAENSSANQQQTSTSSLPLFCLLSTLTTPSSILPPYLLLFLRSKPPFLFKLNTDPMS
jgi:hypothetical protein